MGTITLKKSHCICMQSTCINVYRYQQLLSLHGQFTNKYTEGGKMSSELYLPKQKLKQFKAVVFTNCVLQ